MRKLGALLFVTLAATPACKGGIPDPGKVAKVALDGSIHVVQGTTRAARAARAANQARVQQRVSPPPTHEYAPPPPDNNGLPPPDNNGLPPPDNNGLPPPENAPPGLPEVVQPPIGQLVQARFSASSGETRWVVVSSGRELCETPCTLRFAEGTGLSMVQLDGRRKPSRLDVPYLYTGSYDVRARPRLMGAFAPGVVAAAFGAMGTIAGIVLTAVGCGKGKAGMCEGGLITLGASSAVLAGGIVLVSISGANLIVQQRPTYE